VLNSIYVHLTTQLYGVRIADLLGVNAQDEGLWRGRKFWDFINFKSIISELNLTKWKSKKYRTLGLIAVLGAIYC